MNNRPLYAGLVRSDVLVAFPASTSTYQLESIKEQLLTVNGVKALTRSQAPSEVHFTLAVGRSSQYSPKAVLKIVLADWPPHSRFPAVIDPVSAPGAGGGQRIDIFCMPGEADTDLPQLRAQIQQLAGIIHARFQSERLIQAELHTPSDYHGVMEHLPHVFSDGRCIVLSNKPRELRDRQSVKRWRKSWTYPYETT